MQYESKILVEPILGRKPELVSISNSEIQTFKSDRRKWYLGYYLGLQPKKKSVMGALSLGSRIHNALEVYYTTGDDPVDAYARFLRVDNQKFVVSGEASNEAKLNDFNKEADLGRIMLEGYMEWLDEENPDSLIEVVGAEQKLSYRLDNFDPRVELIGKVDLKVRRAFDGSRATLDHKSATTFHDYYQYARVSEQLKMYTMLEKLDPEGDGKVDGGIYNLLKKVKRTGNAKPPFYDRVDVRFNKQTLDNFWIRTLGTVRDIMYVRDALDEGADHKYVAYASAKMDWTMGTSPFFPIYEMIDDGSAVNEMIKDFYEQVDPNARYEDTNEILTEKDG